jgi:hypothetical protein
MPPSQRTASQSAAIKEHLIAVHTKHGVFIARPDLLTYINAEIAKEGSGLGPPFKGGSSGTWNSFWQTWARLTDYPFVEKKVGSIKVTALNTIAPEPTVYTEGPDFHTRTLLVNPSASNEAKFDLDEYPFKKGFGFTTPEGKEKPAHRIAIFSPSEGGKTFLVALLLRFWFECGVTRFVVQNGTEAVNNTYSKIFGDGAVFGKSDFKAIKKMQREQEKAWKAWTDGGSIGPPPRVVLVLDDCIMDFLGEAAKRKDSWFPGEANYPAHSPKPPSQFPQFFLQSSSSTGATTVSLLSWCHRGAPSTIRPSGAASRTRFACPAC